MSAASEITPEAALLPPRAQAALTHVEAIAASQRDAARSQLAQICAMSALPEEELFDAMTNQLRTCGRIAVHFHPDRDGGHGNTVAGSILASGVLQSQFESGVSNGKLDHATR